MQHTVQFQHVLLYPIFTPKLYRENVDPVRNAIHWSLAFPQPNGRMEFGRRVSFVEYI